MIFQIVYLVIYNKVLQGNPFKVKYIYNRLLSTFFDFTSSYGLPKIHVPPPRAVGIYERIGIVSTLKMYNNM